MILVSACLAGFKCKYNGESNTDERIVELVKKGEAIPVCPEQLGGLPTPRVPSEIISEKVISKNGDDVTEQFNRGAAITLEIAKLYNCTEAIFKSRSPSCGSGKIYDGTFSGTLINGDGITAKLLKENGIKVRTEEETKNNLYLVKKKLVFDTV